MREDDTLLGLIYRAYPSQSALVRLRGRWVAGSLHNCRVECTIPAPTNGTGILRSSFRPVYTGPVKVRTWKAPVETAAVLEFLGRLEAARIPPVHRQSEYVTLDGATYELFFGSYTCGAHYSWHTAAPEGWEVLQEAANTLLSWGSTEEFLW